MHTRHSKLSMILIGGLLAAGLTACTGEDGEDGAPGEQGPAGAQGPAGPAGPVGEDGAQGDDGAPGDDGDPGEDGICAGRDALTIDGINNIPEQLFAGIDSSPIEVDTNAGSGAELSLEVLSGVQSYAFTDNGDGTFTVNSADITEGAARATVIATDGCTVATSQFTLPPVQDPRFTARVTHLSEDAPDSVDIYLIPEGGAIGDEGVVFLNDFGFAQTSGPALIDVGTYTLQIFAGDDEDAENVLIEVPSVELGVGGSATFLAHDSPDGPAVLSVPTAPRGDELGNADITAVHAANGVGQVDILVLGEEDSPLFSDLDFGGVSDTASVPPGAYSLGIDTDNESPAEFEYDLNVPAGQFNVYAFLIDGTPHLFVQGLGDEGFGAVVSPIVGLVSSAEAANVRFTTPTEFVSYGNFEDGLPEDSSFRQWEIFGPADSLYEVVVEISTEANFDDFVLVDQNDDTLFAGSGSQTATVLVVGNNFTTFVDSDFSASAEDREALNGYRILSVSDLGAPTTLRAIHLSNDAPERVDIFLFPAGEGPDSEDALVLDNFPFKGATPGLAIPSGDYGIQIFSSEDEDAENALITLDSITLDANGDVTVLAHDSPNGPALLPVPSNLEPAGEGFGGITAIHAANGVGQVDIFALGETPAALFEDLDFGGISEPLNAAIGPVLLGLDTNNELPAEFAFPASVPEANINVYAFLDGDVPSLFVQPVAPQSEPAVIAPLEGEVIGEVTDNNGDVDFFIVPSETISYFADENGDPTDSSFRSWTVNGADSLSVTFLVDTEEGFDFLVVVDADDNEVGRFDVEGEEVNVLIAGNTFTTFVESDSGVQGSGYQIIDVEINPL